MHTLAFLGGGVLHPLGYCTGTRAAVVACRGYNFWSGIVSDFGEVTLITAVLAGFYGAYRKHKCGHCWRPARHQVHVVREDGHTETHPTCRGHLDENHALKARLK